MIELERFAYEPDCTLGVLRIGDFECFTIERPWAQNAQGRSCIPEGSYGLLGGHRFHGTYPCPKLSGVPDRSDILIHVANVASELRGCIAPGMSLGVMKGQRAVLGSRNALHEIMERYAAEGSSILVRFRNRYGVVAP